MLVRVAAILRPTIPDFPTPIKTTLPWQLASIATALLIASGSIRCAALVIASASNFRSSITWE